jgi:hypothetical protein
MKMFLVFKFIKPSAFIRVHLRLKSRSLRGPSYHER